VNYKHLLKFYFCADGLNDALDAVIVRLANSSADGFKGCEYYAERISKVIEAKSGLNELWLFLDGAIKTMNDGDVAALLSYSARRERGGAGDKTAEKAEHRALMKLSRRLSGRLERFAEQVKVLREYYCLVGAHSG